MARRNAHRDRIYVPYPKEKYYRLVLSDPNDFGLNLKSE
jgi:hypothetical protein